MSQSTVSERPDFLLLEHREESMLQNLSGSLLLAQGLYYAVTGLWSLVSLRTFMMVTGPKTDHWLVKTVGVLVSVIGGVLAMAGWRRRLVPEIGLLSVGSALGLAGIEFFYALRGRISLVYLLDAVVELGFIAVQVLTWTRPQDAAGKRW